MFVKSTITQESQKTETETYTSTLARLATRKSSFKNSEISQTSPPPPRKNGKKEIFSVKCQFVEFNVNHEFSYTLQIFLNVQKEACDETIHSLL